MKKHRVQQQKQQQQQTKNHPQPPSTLKSKLELKIKKDQLNSLYFDKPTKKTKTTTNSPQTNSSIQLFKQPNKNPLTSPILPNQANETYYKTIKPVDYLHQFQKLSEKYEYTFSIQNMLRRMTKDKNQTLREPVYVWCKNITEVLLMNQIQIAHWAVLMKKVYWTPPTYNSLFDILLFTAFTAKQYYCHPNDFPTFTFKLDYDRPGFVVSHSHWVKQNSINIRSWEVNQKFNKLKRPLNGYTQKSFGAQQLSGNNQCEKQQFRSNSLATNPEQNQEIIYNIEKDKQLPQNKRSKVHFDKNQSTTRAFFPLCDQKVPQHDPKTSSKPRTCNNIRQERRYSQYQKLIWPMDSGGTDMLGLQNQADKIKQLQGKKNMQNEIDQFIKQLEKKEEQPKSTKYSSSPQSNKKIKQDFLTGITRQKTNKSQQFEDQLNELSFLNEELIFQRQGSLYQNSNDGNLNEDDQLPKIGTEKSYCLEYPKLQKNQSYL